MIRTRELVVIKPPYWVWYTEAVDGEARLIPRSSLPPMAVCIAESPRDEYILGYVL